MKTNLKLLALIALAGSLTQLNAADITGKVTLKGAPPGERTLPLDPQCAALHTDKPTTRFYMVADDGGLADTFVSLKGISGKSTGASAKPALINQKGCEYLPYVLTVQTGQKILVRNSDPVLHNVHPTPAVAGNPEANKAQLANAPDLEFVFNNPEEFLRFKCDVHPWMFSYVNVTDHPYADVTAEAGTFKISNVPPGKYTIEANHRKAGKVSKEIEVKDSDVTVDFELEAPAQ